MALGLCVPFDWGLAHPMLRLACWGHVKTMPVRSGLLAGPFGLQASAVPCRAVPVPCRASAVPWVAVGRCGLLWGFRGVPWVAVPCRGPFCLSFLRSDGHVRAPAVPCPCLVPFGPVRPFPRKARAPTSFL